MFRAGRIAAVPPRPVTTYGGQSFFPCELSRLVKSGGSRTRNLRILSPVLYPMSYTLGGTYTFLRQNPQTERERTDS